MFLQMMGVWTLESSCDVDPYWNTVACDPNHSFLQKIKEISLAADASLLSAKLVLTCALQSKHHCLAQMDHDKVEEQTLEDAQADDEMSAAPAVGAL